MNYLLSTGVEALRDLQQRQVATFSLSNVPSLPVRLGTVLVFLRPSAAIDEDMKVFTLPVLYTLAVLVKAREPRLHHKLGVFGAGLAAVDGGFGAPLGGEAAHSLVYVFVEAQQVADYTAIQVGAVGIGVSQVGGFQLPVAEVVEDVLGGGKLVVAEGAEVQDGGTQRHGW